MTACPGRLVLRRRVGLCLTCAHVDVTANASPDAPAFVQTGGVWACESWAAHMQSMGAIYADVAPTDRGAGGGNRGGVAIHRMGA